ncbi:MAG: UDP-N-acetylglucosamine--N-acetylmuramyl-(pentapeptide) pyrophosphoryl-undecaprenol N-acetylglucosamine transferase [Tepidamorphaceae bacterium]
MPLAVRAGICFAEALATVLTARGWRVELVTDTRVSNFGKAFPRAACMVPSGTISPLHPIKAIRGAYRLVRGYYAARNLISMIGPDIVVGFGGYPTLPPVIAATHKGVPTLIHDQNAVMGRANWLLARHATGIATAFDSVKYLEEVYAGKARRVGVPVRAAVLTAAKQKYDEPKPGGDLKLLVFGGSQGARIMSEIVPPGLSTLPQDIRARLHVVQQCRAEDLDEVRQIYAGAGIDADLQPFFSDLPKRMAAAHLVIARSGASTVAELSVIGRPAIMVPLPHALDNDQLYNGRALEEAGGGRVIEQVRFTPDTVGRAVLELAHDPKQLAAQAAAARRFGTPKAAEALADFATEIAEHGSVGVSPA